MNKSEFFPQLASRREFIRCGLCKTAGTAVLANTVLDLLLMNRAMADQSPLSGYKALVCVFLNGGNDSNQVIIPTSPAEWTSYSAVRGPTLAIPNVNETNATTKAATAQALKLSNGSWYQDAQGHTYGLHPALRELAWLFNQKDATGNPYTYAKMAPVLNLGTLSYPLTKAQYTSTPSHRPPQLFSHSDQQTQWQTSIPDQPPSSGWGGRIGDLFTTPVNQNVGGQISMAVSLAGSNLFEVGSLNAAAQYSVGTGGAVGLTTLTGNRLTALQSILAADKLLPDLQTAAYGSVLDHAINEAGVVNTGLATNASASFVTAFPTNVVTPNGGSNFSSSLMAQMKMVARLIELGSKSVAAGGLEMKRQIFFVQVGGYDTHTNQTNNTGSSTTDNAKVVIGSQANLLAELSQSIDALFKALNTIGVRYGTNLTNSVTAFTVSDFARTFQPNGQGSDHGWGGNHVVVGGAVNGGATYGKLPVLSINGPDDTGLGRWIPTTSVDQYAAALAGWFGVESANIPLIFPNIGRFGILSNPFI